MSISAVLLEISETFLLANVAGFRNSFRYMRRQFSLLIECVRSAHFCRFTYGEDASAIAGALNAPFPLHSFLSCFGPKIRQQTKTHSLTPRRRRLLLLLLLLRQHTGRRRTRFRAKEGGGGEIDELVSCTTVCLDGHGRGREGIDVRTDPKWEGG